MEGIVDGGAEDECYYCALLYSGLSPCPLCGNQFRYRPARVGTAPSSIKEESTLRITEYRLDPKRRTATNLLEWLYREGEDAMAYFDETGLSMDRLRAHYPRPETIPDAPKRQAGQGRPKKEES